MKKRIACFVFIMFFIISFSANIFAANEQDSFDEDETTTVESISEYDMVCAQEARWSVTRSAGKSPLEEYKEFLDERAALDEQQLSAMGYTDEEVVILKSYLAGEVSFEYAARYTSAVLSTSLTCPVHTETLYTVLYHWVWDKQPAGEDECGFALGLIGINYLSQSFVTSLDEYYGVVRYHYISNNAFHHYETPSIDYDNTKVELEFDSYKLDTTATYWLYAKEGSVRMTIEPAVSGTTTFSAVKAAGAYIYNKTSLDISVSASVDILSGAIGISFTPENNTKIMKVGEKHYIFYNDGTKNEEVNEGDFTS